MAETRDQVIDMNRNPTGKGGFQDRPGDRNKGTWNPEMVFSFQYRRFMNMDAKKFIEFAEKIKAKDCTMVEMAAYMRVKDMHKSLPDVKEITDRTEGKAAQAVDVTTNGKDLPSPIMAISRDE